MVVITLLQHYNVTRNSYWPLTIEEAFRRAESEWRKRVEKSEVDEKNVKEKLSLQLEFLRGGAWKCRELKKDYLGWAIMCWFISSFLIILLLYSSPDVARAAYPLVVFLATWFDLEGVAGLYYYRVYRNRLKQFRKKIDEIERDLRTLEIVEYVKSK